MKKNFLYLFLSILVTSFISCSNKQKKSLDEQNQAVEVRSRTVIDLEDALNGEATATAKYAAFAEQAAKDGFPQIEALFEATSKAESIHVKNHQNALHNIGVKDYQPKVDAFQVKTTAENLQAAVAGEEYEFKYMYPPYMRDAENDYQDEALLSFKYARSAEISHAQLYSKMLAGIKTPKALSTVFLVCPTCGMVYSEQRTNPCELCNSQPDKFIRFEASR